MRIGRWIAALAAVAIFAVVVVATSTDDPSGSDTTSTTGLGSTTTMEAAAVDPDLAALTGRLLVTTEQGAIFTVGPDGSDRQVIAQASENVALRGLPVWSPDSSKIAWAERSTDEISSLIVAAASGEIETQVDVDFVPGYMAWDSTGSSLAFTGDDGRANQVLQVFDLQTGAITQIAEGAPLYLDWARDDGEILVHGDDFLRYMTPTGSEVSSVAEFGDFRVPVNRDSESIIGIGRDIGQELVLADRQGVPIRRLLRYGTPMAFTVRENRIAVLSKGSPVNQQLTLLEETDLPILAPNNLQLVDAATGEITQVAEGRGVAWFFSPDGTSMTFITEETIGEEQRLQWHIWDGAMVTDLAVFAPTGRFGRDYLAFFDQFDRSTSLWSPDGSAFVYAGGNDAEDVGVWVHDLNLGEPRRIGPGVAVTWSPTG